MLILVPRTHTHTSKFQPKRARKKNYKQYPNVYLNILSRLLVKLGIIFAFFSLSLFLSSFSFLSPPVQRTWVSPLLRYFLLSDKLDACHFNAQRKAKREFVFKRRKKNYKSQAHTYVSTHTHSHTLIHFICLKIHRSVYISVVAVTHT